LAVAFYLPTRVFTVLALVLAEGSLIDSLPGGRAKTEMARIRMSLSKPKMGEMKLTKACVQTKETYDFKKMRKVVLTRAPYLVSFHPDLVGANLLVSHLAGGVLKHFFQEFN
jgi:hypothetical protein